MKPATSPPQPPPVVQVQALMQGRREVLIVHQGQTYRLRLTAQNKLILTK